MRPINSLISSGNLRFPNYPVYGIWILDNLLGLNDLDNFQEVHKTVNPDELDLSCTGNLGIQAYYLDLKMIFLPVNYLTN